MTDDSPLRTSQLAIGAYFRGLCSCMEKPKAVTAAAHKLARLIYTMLTRGEEHIDQGQDYYEERHRERVLRQLSNVTVFRRRWESARRTAVRVIRESRCAPRGLHRLLRSASSLDDAGCGLGPDFFQGAGTRRRWLTQMPSPVGRTSLKTESAVMHTPTIVADGGRMCSERIDRPVGSCADMGVSCG